MTDNRTNEPSDAQVEAAAKIIRRASLETTANPGDFWSDCYEGEREAWRNAARAALVAAAGAVQEASCPERPGGRPCESTKPGHRMHWSNGPSAESDHAKLIADARALSEYVSEHIPGSRYKPMIDRLANALETVPVLPSSGVDEGKIAEVIAKATYDWSQQRLEFWRRPASVESPGDLDQYIARAFVEAIGGEGRGSR